MMKRTARPNLLIIDDDPVFRRLMGVMFTQEGYSVATADSAESAFKLLSSHSFQVAVVDYKLPDLNGIEFLERIKHTYPDMMRILITAHTSEDVLLEAINRGEVYRYINKPVHTGLLRSTVEQALALHQLTISRSLMVKEMDERNRELTLKNEELKAYNALISEMKIQQDRILASLPDPYLLTRSDRRIVRCNPAAANLLGYKRPELVGRIVGELFEDPAEFEKRLAESSSTRSNAFEINMRRKEGELLAVKVFLSIFRSHIKSDINNLTIAVLAQKLPRRPFEKVDDPLYKEASKSLADKPPEEIQNIFDSMVAAVKDLTERWKEAMDIFDHYLEDEGIPPSEAKAIRKATDEVTNSVQTLLQTVILD